MELFSLILYAVVNLWILIRYFAGPKGKVYEFPFWMALMAVGWFLPQAIGGYANVDCYPQGSYATALIFATFCSIALLVGYEISVSKGIKKSSWLCMQLQPKKLYLASAGLILFGFYFFFKLSRLTPEQITVTEFGQWTGVTVRYLFLSGAFKVGVLALLLLYCGQRRLLNTRFLIFLIPALIMMLTPIIFGGRRADMMELTAYSLISVWFVRGWVIPRTLLLVSLSVGLIFINSIGLYRGVMDKGKEMDLNERIRIALNQDYLGQNFNTLETSGPEFENYVFRMDAVNKLDSFDYGLSHWNMLVFNYVPAQIVGQELKSSLMVPIFTPSQAGWNEYQFYGQAGATDTGYLDAFASFSWLGFIKFYLIGVIMGRLYQYAGKGYFLSRLLYIFLLTAGMHAITHTTNDVLVRMWVYFLIFGFPIYYWARARTRWSVGSIERQTLYKHERGAG